MCGPLREVVTPTSSLQLLTSMEGHKQAAKNSPADQSIPVSVTAPCGVVPILLFCTSSAGSGQSLPMKGVEWVVEQKQIIHGVPLGEA